MKYNLAQQEEYKLNTTLELIKLQCQDWSSTI